MSASWMGAQAGFAVIVAVQAGWLMLALAGRAPAAGTRLLPLLAALAVVLALVLGLTGRPWTAAAELAAICTLFSALRLLPSGSGAFGIPVVVLGLSLVALALMRRLDAGVDATAYGAVTCLSALLLAAAIAACLGSATIAAGTLACLGLVWGYAAMMQFLVIWESNLATEAGWYADRLRGAGGLVGLAILVAGVTAPLVLLARPALLRPAAAVQAATQIGYLLWQMLPAAPDPATLASCLVCLLASGGAMAMFARGRPARDSHPHG